MMRAMSVSPAAVRDSILSTIAFHKTSWCSLISAGSRAIMDLPSSAADGPTGRAVHCEFGPSDTGPSTTPPSTQSHLPEHGPRQGAFAVGEIGQDGEVVQPRTRNHPDRRAPFAPGGVQVGTLAVEFGAFVELVPGTDGLVHISQLSDERVDKVTDVLQEGEIVTVKVIGFDKRGKLKLAMVNNGG
ncbi:MAG: S1 RNA-binding domain-containing protein [Proteobacteria bacterium]|nr:S1 RNA-binding domain-containing protein [Pseudomonadota bacterium]